MSDDIDQSSFASILAGVQKMRDAYETQPSKRQKLPLPSNKDNVQREAPSVATTKPSSSSNNSTSNSSRNNDAKPTGNSNRPASGSNTSNSATKNVPLSNSASRSKRIRVHNDVHSYSSIQVAQSQKGNPLLDSPSMKMTSWSYSGLVLLDYYINATIQVLFLSLKYHKLRPEYVWRRIEKLKGGTSSTDVDANDQSLRVLLVVVDIDSPQDALRSLLVICVKHDLTLVIAWSFEEAGNYIAYLKQNEMARSKVVSSIQGIKKGDYNSHILETLTTVRAVNKTDVANLLANCKSFKDIVLASANEDGLDQIPGLGQRKVENLKAVFSNPFIFNKDSE